MLKGGGRSVKKDNQELGVDIMSDRRAWRIAYTIIERYGDVKPGRIDLALLQKDIRKVCPKQKEFSRVMKCIRIIRREQQ